jgi:hypothetical protein
MRWLRISFGARARRRLHAPKFIIANVVADQSWTDEPASLVGRPKTPMAEVGWYVRKVQC